MHAVLKVDIAVGEVEDAIETVLGQRYRLTPLGVKCTYPVFKGEFDGAAPVFVKIGTQDEWRQTIGLLKDIGSCGYFAKFLTERPIAYRGQAVFVMEWRETRTVYPEDMSAVQVASFVEGCMTLSRSLQGVKDTVPQSPETLYEAVLGYVAHHPFAGRLLKGLVEIPKAERTFGTRLLSVCHGDFHAKNYGFRGKCFASVYDFDKLTTGLACGDMANALVERFSCLGLPKSTRCRLMRVTADVVAQSPWPVEEFVISCNIIRLGFAARRIAKHPDSSWVALDILRRDRALRGFLVALNR